MVPRSTPRAVPRDRSSVDGGRPRRSGAPTPGVSALLRTILYLVTLVPFILVYSNRDVPYVASALIALISAAATWLLLRNARASSSEKLLHAGIVGLIVGEMAWALGYWSVLPLVGGAALWLAFYVLSGVAEHAVSNTLDRRVGQEYAVVSVLGILIVLVSMPWRA